jgi:hypothetical protein
VWTLILNIIFLSYQVYPYFGYQSPFTIDNAYYQICFDCGLPFIAIILPISDDSLPLRYDDPNIRILVYSLKLCPFSKIVPLAILFVFVFLFSL